MQRESSPVRTRRVDEIAEALPQRASAIARLFLRHSSIEISRTEAGVLRALSERSRRITELAAREGVTQPAITMLVNRLEERGWVARESDPSDARAVLVELTHDGRQVFETLRAEYRALLHEEVATLPDRDVAALARAVEILDGLIDRLRERGA
jgi:DNA-binding MarR family transcriptional regulator